MQRLISRLPRSDEEVADIEQGKIKEARAESDRLWDAYEKEELQKKVEKTLETIQQKLAAEGKDLPTKEDALQMTQRAVEKITEARKRGVLPEGYFEYLAEGEGDNPDLIIAWGRVAKSIEDYDAREAEKKGGRK